MKLLCFLIFLTPLSYGYDVEINLTEQKSVEGEVGIVIFNTKKGFPRVAKNAFIKDFISISKFPYIVDLPAGEYAISIFHDENGNRELDTNIIGIPKESFGFSNNVMGMMGPPSFKDAKFKVSDKLNTISIELKQF